jgi:hypothetical protein
MTLNCRIPSTSSNNILAESHSFQIPYTSVDHYTPSGGNGFCLGRPQKLFQNHLETHHRAAVARRWIETTP